MKHNKLVSTIQVIALLFIISQTHAIDISVGPLTVLPSSDVGFNQSYSIAFDITNNNDGSGEEATNIQVRLDLDGAGTASNILLNSTLNSIPIGWVDFSYGPGVLVLDFIPQMPLAVGESLTFQADFTAGNNTVVSELLHFDAGDAILLDSNFSNNLGSSQINIGPVGTTIDYELIRNPAFNSPIEIIENSTANLPFSFILTNIGDIDSFGEGLDVQSPVGYSMSNVSMTNVGLSNWSCTGNMAGNSFNCFNNAMSAGMLPGDSVFISGELSSYPTNVGLTTDVITTTLFISGDVDGSNDTDSFALNVSPAPLDPDIIITKTTVTPLVNNEAEVGTEITYRVLAKNNTSGSVDGDTVVINDVLPAGVSYVSHTEVGPNFMCGPFQMMTNTLTCTATNLPFTNADDGVDITVVVDGNPGTQVTNTALVTAINDEDSSNNSSTTNAFIIIVAPPLEVDLDIAINAQNPGASTSSGSFVVNTDFEYQLMISNFGPDDASIGEVEVINVLPTEIELISVPNSPGWDCSNTNGNVVSCRNTQSMPASTINSLELIIPVRGIVITNGVANSADVSLATSSTATESNLINNNASTDVDITAVPVVTTLSITNSPFVNGSPVSSISRGSEILYQIRVINEGSTDAINLEVIEDISLRVQLNSINAPGWDCNQTLPIIRCNYLGLLAAGTDSLLEFNVTDISEDGVSQVRNSVIASAMNSAAVSGVNILNIDSDNNGDVSLTVSQNPNPVAAGSTFDLIVDIANFRNGSLTEVVMVNTLPNGFSYNSITRASTCMINGQIMTCNLDTDLFSDTTESIVISATSNASINTSASFNNITSVTASNLDGSITKNTPISILQPGQVSYSIEIENDIESVEVGVPFEYVVSLNNTGISPISTIDLNIDIPTGITVNSVSSSNLNCSNIATGLRCSATNNFVVDGGEEQEILTINLQSSAFVGDISIDATANVQGTQQMAMSGVVTITNVIIENADLSVSLISGAGIEQGEFTQFSVDVTNNIESDFAQSPLVSIDLEGIISNVTVDLAPGWDCQVANLSVLCQFMAAQMEPGHNSTILVSIKSPSQVADDNTFTLNASITSDTNDPNPSNNDATAQVGVNGTPTEAEFLAAMRAALDGRGNQQVNRAIQNVSSYCGNDYFGALEGFCADLLTTALDFDGETINTVMEQITPNEVIGQSTSVAEIATAQFRNVGARLSQLRGGGGSGFSTAGLNARYGSGSIPLGMLSYLNQSENETDGVINTANDFISPWGFFVNGTISMGERDATGRELGFDFDSFGLTAGVDYRLDAKKVLGIAIGYANFDSEVGDDAELNSTSVTLTGYGSFYINDNFYVDSRISISQPEFDQSRDINFTLAGNTIDRTALGSTDASQYTFALSAGYHFNKNAWNITPNATIRYISTSIDGFRETGAGDFNFVYSDQDYESMVWSAGLKISKAISLKKGVITPQFDFDYNYESLNDGDDIEARFVMAPIDEIFIIETDSPDRSYGSAGLGLVYVSSNGKQAYINYRSVLGLDGFSRGTINIGARFEF